jgi:hypothetical protein
MGGGQAEFAKADAEAAQKEVNGNYAGAGFSRAFTRPDFRARSWVHRFRESSKLPAALGRVSESAMRMPPAHVLRRRKRPNSSVLQMKLK